MKPVILVMLSASALLYFPMAFEEFEQPKITALVGFACFAAFFVDWRVLKRDSVAQAVVALVLSAGVSMVFSIDKHMSIWGNVRCPAGLLAYFAYLVFYLAALRAVKSRRDAEHAVTVILFTAFLVAGYAVLQAFGVDYKQWYGTLVDHGYFRPMSTLGHPNFMAGYLAMVLPFGLWWCEKAKNRYGRVFVGALILVSTCAVIFSQSRGMWLAALVGVATYAKLAGLRKRWAAIALMAATICAVAIPTFRATVTDRLEHLFDLGLARSEYPTAAVRIWKRNPVFGSGTDTFEIAFQRQRTPAYWQFEPRGSPHKAHNDFLNTLATQGIVGAIAALLVTVAALTRVLGSVSPLKAPATAAIAAWYVEGLSSFTVAATGCMFLLCLALLLLPQE
jgi:O-antigen ligase